MDGGTVEGEVIKRFENLTEEEVETMTVQQYEEYERRRMEKNAWFVAENITRPIDDTIQFLATTLQPSLPNGLKMHFLYLRT